MSNGPPLPDNQDNRHPVKRGDVSAELRAALEPQGLAIRGAVHFKSGDGPLLPDGRSAAFVCLIGHIGSAHWPAFSAWRETSPEGGLPDPLDRWSKQLILPLAARLGATAFFPSDPPYQPFQHWAMLAEGLKASPLGILIHPVFGLWHGYRGALAFAERPEGFAGLEESPSAFACETCRDRPCLAACPAGAIWPDGFQYTPCRTHLGSGAGRDCLDGGCLARNACPVGSQHRYLPDQLRFHMAALSLPAAD